MASVFSQRRNGYRVGVLFLLLSAVMATWGVVAPGWLKSDVVGDGEGVIYSDLWFINCRHDLSSCDTPEFKMDDASLLATLGLVSLGLLLLLCSCVAIVRNNFCLTFVTYGRSAELLALLAGLLLFIGCMTYVGDNADFIADFPAYTFGPSFILTLIASVLTGLGGFLLSIYNKEPGTSYYSRFRRPVPSFSSATMVEATTASISSISGATTATTSTLQIQGYCPGEPYRVGYGFQQYDLNSTGGRSSRSGGGGGGGGGMYYGNEHSLFGNFQKLR